MKNHLLSGNKRFRGLCVNRENHTKINRRKIIAFFRASAVLSLPQYKQQEAGCFILGKKKLYNFPEIYIIV